MGRCKKCDAEIEFIKTPAGKWMPCDWEVRDWPDGVVIDTMGRVHSDGGTGHRPHWASCPAAHSFRDRQTRIPGVE